MSTSQLCFRRKIGDALYGEVFECELHEQQSRCFVAVKSISLSYAVDLRKRLGVDRILDDPSQECRVAEMLSTSGGHQNVVHSFFHFQEHGSLYLVNEFCAEGDLYNHLAQVGAMTERRSIEIMAQIFAGVDYLHHHLGIAHRDLSLENVLMHNGQCKISDFGLSVGANERCVERVGKNYYMAPEVVTGVEYNPVQADIWSLGIIWFILITGSPLVSIASRQNKAFIALEQCGVADVFVSWKCNTNLSVPFIELISQMLKVDPTERISLKGIMEHPCLKHNSRQCTK